MLSKERVNEKINIFKMHTELKIHMHNDAYIFIHISVNSLPIFPEDAAIRFLFSVYHSI